jgi:chemotaxis protein CheD
MASTGKEMMDASKETTRAVYLTEGMVFASLERYYVTTVLGSCIAVCLWDTFIGAGGMNHYMLPLWNGEGLPTPRYGNIAITKLIQKMMLLGCKKRTLRAKVFGGATALYVGGTGKGGKENFSAGVRNIIIAEDMLEAEGIPIISCDVGGAFGRKLKFDTGTGTVLLKRFEQRTRVDYSISRSKRTAEVTGKAYAPGKNAWKNTDEEGT